MEEREGKTCSRVLFGWRKEEGYKYPSPIIEPLEAISCVCREAGPKAGMEYSRAERPALGPA